MGGLVTNKTTFEANGRDAFVLDRLEDVADADLGKEGSFEFYLDADTSITTSQVIHGFGINLEQLSQLVVDPSKNGVIIELYRKFR